MIAIAILFLASVIPPVYLAKKIYAMDRIEPEPRRLIRKLVLCGALACLPAVILEYLTPGRGDLQIFLFEAADLDLSGI